MIGWNFILLLHHFAFIRVARLSSELVGAAEKCCSFSLWRNAECWPTWASFCLSGERFREFLDELIGFIDNDDLNIINSKVARFMSFWMSLTLKDHEAWIIYAKHFLSSHVFNEKWQILKIVPAVVTAENNKTTELNLELKLFCVSPPGMFIKYLQINQFLCVFIEIFFYFFSLLKLICFVVETSSCQWSDVSDNRTIK